MYLSNELLSIPQLSRYSFVAPIPLFGTNHVWVAINSSPPYLLTPPDLIISHVLYPSVIYGLGRSFDIFISLEKCCFSELAKMHTKKKWSELYLAC